MTTTEKFIKATTKSSIKFLVYISCVLGIVPYSITEYASNKVLKISILGNIYCFLVMIHNALQYHFSQKQFSLGNEGDTTSLTVAIGIFIMYLEPLMMVVDIFAGIINQKSLIECFDRLQKIDEKLLKESDIEINYRKISKISIFLTFGFIIGEFYIIFMNFILFLDINLYSLWFLLTVLPILTNSIARIWFFLLVFSVRERFRAINDYFVKTKDLFFENKRKFELAGLKNNFNGSSGSNRNIETIAYLSEEIFAGRRKNFKNNKIFTTDSSYGNDIINTVPYKENINRKQVDQSQIQDDLSEFNEKDGVIGEKMDKKLIMLCRLHDEICEIGKLVNKMYSFQMLMTMAFGFMNITAQFYFLYCGLAQQPVPKLFRSAENVPITIIYICFTATKCVSIIYISWKTKTDAQKTGIQLHKIANVVDENHFYHIVNHLSLKLLNHQLNFTACGFFDLDMTTVYAITGAITSYLIILIQFNIAADQTTKTDNSTVTTAIAILSTTAAAIKAN